MFWPADFVEDLLVRYAALEDNALVDVSEAGRAAGIGCPCTITGGAFRAAVVCQESDRALGQSEEGRLHDVLSAAWATTATARGQRSTVPFRVRVVAATGPRDVHLRASRAFGAGHDPVLTVELDEPAGRPKDPILPTGAPR